MATDPTQPHQLPLAEPTKRGRGRPRKHIDGAAKQKAYRERQRAAGMREERRWVKDDGDAR